ncbi:WD repeat-containing protein 61 [Cantharellus anzutake]|uniref:WD repeat-containing protein 61 n=1 Tax=Cantharellus anzutake TaxID=1750568 RepID=UPI001908EE96|nr:WD repeat-containing protein 61 [Cantharellus anzutake]KAF8339184.1 WD repeat-containing protein 61 [Cantharellus anzutake]
MSLQFIHSHDSPKVGLDAIYGVKWLPNDTVVSVSADGKASQWNASDGAVIHSLPPHPLALTSLSTDAEGNRALINSIEGTISLWDLTSGEVVGKRETFDQAKSGIDAAWSVSLHPQGGNYASTGASGTLRISSADPESFGNILQTLSPRTDGRNKFGLHAKYSPSGKLVGISTEQGAVYVFDVESKAVVHSFSSHATSVRSLSWSADSQLLCSASDDRRIVLYDTRSPSATSPNANSSTGVVASFIGHASWVLSVDISPDGKLIASGSSDRNVKIWDLTSRQCVSTLSSSSEQSGEVWGVSWKPVAGSSALVSTGEDGSLRWWRTAGAGASV